MLLNFVYLTNLQRNWTLNTMQHKLTLGNS